MKFKVTKKTETITENEDGGIQTKYSYALENTDGDDKLTLKTTCDDHVVGDEFTLEKDHAQTKISE